MQPVIVSDTTCLILLHKIGELNLLQKLLHEIFTTQIVADEFGRRTTRLDKYPKPGLIERIK